LVEEGHKMITRDRLEGRDDLEALWQAPAAAPAPDDSGSGSARTGGGTGWWRGLLLGWLVVLGTLLLFEPRPSGASPALPLWATALSVAFLGAWCATLTGLVRRRSWGFPASAIAAGLGIAIAAACAVTEHHTGMWWAYEAVAFGSLGAASVVAARTVDR
jgi:O-antigen/teichoic acid export membrane protein